MLTATVQNVCHVDGSFAQPFGQEDLHSCVHSCVFPPAPPACFRASMRGYVSFIPPPLKFAQGDL